MPSIWNKYKLSKDLTSNKNIKTYLATFEPIIKEITLKDEDSKFEIYEHFENLKEELKIYEMIEEKDKIYLVVEQDEETNKKIDEIILSNEYSIRKECVIEGEIEPLTKDEILKLFNMEESLCKITFEKVKNNNIEKGKGTGFFCEIDNENFPIKHCLFTNNHVLDANCISTNKTINFEYYVGKKYVEKEIKITENRKVFTNKQLDYTCIELFKSDGIQKYLKIDPLLFWSKDNDFLNEKDIFVLQYPKGDKISFSFGKIKKVTENKIAHNASTYNGSSGSPIIRRSDKNYVIGIHFGSKKHNNLATKINSILKDISTDILKPNEINCVYKPKENEKEITLIYDYNKSKGDMQLWSEQEKKLFLDTKEINKKLFKEKTELYVNNEKIKFDYKYKINDSKEIKVKFKFNAKLTNINYMFYKCSSLESIDLSKLNTSNVFNMSCMFYDCKSLKTINLTSLNTSNVTDMSYMFSGCSSLESIDLSSLNTGNVNNMKSMFSICTSLKSIDISNLNTSNVNYMSGMFSECSSLESIDLSSFNTTNVNNMRAMFFGCIALKSLDLSSFNTSNVSVDNMMGLLDECPSLKKENIKIKNDKNDSLLSYINNEFH